MPVAGWPFNLVPLMGTPKGYSSRSSFNIRTHYYFLYLIFVTLHPRVASIRPLMGTPEGYNY